MANNRGAVLLDVVHGSDGALRIILVGVAHKSEAAAAACVSILDDDLLSAKGNGTLSTSCPLPGENMARPDQTGVSSLKGLAPSQRANKHTQKHTHTHAQTKTQKELCSTRTASSTTPNSSNF